MSLYSLVLSLWRPSQSHMMAELVSNHWKVPELVRCLLVAASVYHIYIRVLIWCQWTPQPAIKSFPLSSCLKASRSLYRHLKLGWHIRVLLVPLSRPEVLVKYQNTPQLSTPPISVSCPWRPHQYIVTASRFSYKARGLPGSLSCSSAILVVQKPPELSIRVCSHICNLDYSSSAIQLRVGLEYLWPPQYIIIDSKSLYGAGGLLDLLSSSSQSRATEAGFNVTLPSQDLNCDVEVELPQILLDIMRAPPKV